MEENCLMQIRLYSAYIVAIERVIALKQIDLSYYVDIIQICCGVFLTLNILTQGEN